MVDGQAVDHQRADAHLFEAARGAAEEIAFGRPPVLPEDTAHAVSAAPEGEPDGQPGLEQQLDRLEQLRIAHERERLEQDQVGRLLGEHTGEELERPAATWRVHLLGDCEGDRALVRTASVLDRTSREPDAEPRDVHPVRRLSCSRPRPDLELRCGQDRPGVRRQHVAARVDIALVHVEDGLWRPVERPRAPELPRARRRALAAL